MTTTPLPNISPKRAILYVRVSTDEQADKGHSLAHQEEQLRRYCLHNNIEVVGFYREDHSAKTFNRPEFKKLMLAVKAKPSHVDYLLFLKWDRFSRNAPEAYAMISKLYRYGVEPQGIEQPLDLSIPEQKFLLALYLTAPEVENDRRALNILSGVRKGMRQGRFMGAPPYGYKRGRDSENKSWIVPSEAEAKLVQAAFEMMATGNYHIEELRRMLAKRGMKLQKSRFWCVLRNPTYIGKVCVPAHKKEAAEIVKGIHEPIISEGLYYEVQDALEGRRKPVPPSPFCQKDELPLRGYLKCPSCNRILTGSASKGRNARYYYYHCSGGCKERFKAEEVNERFMSLLCSVSGQKKVLRSFELIMKDANGKGNKEKSGELVAAKKELEVISKRLDSAQMMMLDGGLDTQEYRNIKAKLEPEKERLVSRLMSLSSPKTKEGEMIAFGVYFLQNLDKLFTSADLSLKRKIIGSTFPEKLVYEKGGYRTAENENVVSLISILGKGLEQKKKEDKNFSCLPSGGVEGSGEMSNFFEQDLVAFAAY